MSTADLVWSLCSRAEKNSEGTVSEQVQMKQGSRLRSWASFCNRDTTLRGLDLDFPGRGVDTAYDRSRAERSLEEALCELLVVSRAASGWDVAGRDGAGVVGPCTSGASVGLEDRVVARDDSGEEEALSLGTGPSGDVGGDDGAE